MIWTFNHQINPFGQKFFILIRGSRRHIMTVLLHTVMRMGYKLLGSGKNFPGIFRTWQKGLTFVYFLMWQHACCRLQVQLWFGLIQSFHLVLPLGNKARMSRISYAAWVTHWGFYALGRLLHGILQKEKRGWLSCACLSFNSFCTFFLSWFCLEYTCFFLEIFYCREQKSHFLFIFVFFHHDIEWRGEENVKPSRFCEYIQVTISDQSLEFCAFSQTLQMHWNATCLCPVMMMQLQQVITSLHSIVPAVLN